VRRTTPPPLDLALEDAQLVPEDQELEPEAGVRASAITEARPILVDKSGGWG